MNIVNSGLISVEAGSIKEKEEAHKVSGKDWENSERVSPRNNESREIGSGNPPEDDSSSPANSEIGYVVET